MPLSKCRTSLKTFDAPRDEWSDFVTKGRAGTLSHDFDAEIDSILVNPHGKDSKAKGALFLLSASTHQKYYSSKAIHPYLAN